MPEILTDAYLLFTFVFKQALKFLIGADGLLTIVYVAYIRSEKRPGNCKSGHDYCYH